MNTYTATLEKSEMIALETKFFNFVLDEGCEDFNFESGQFIVAKVAENTFRSYSVCSLPGNLPKFDLVIKLIPNGIGSTYFDNLQPGDKIEFRGPAGHFVLPETKKDKIFIATGAGIAPMRSFWKNIFSKEDPENVHLIYGYRYEEHAVFLDEMNELKEKANGKFDYEIAVSRPKMQDYIGTKGRVTDIITEKSPEFFSGKRIFVCGSKQMQEQVVGILESKGVAKEDILYEIY